MTVERVFQHLPIPTTRAAIALQGGKEKVAISLVRNTSFKIELSLLSVREKSIQKKRRTTMYEELHF